MLALCAVYGITPRAPLVTPARRSIVGALSFVIDGPADLSVLERRRTSVEPAACSDALPLPPTKDMTLEPPAPPRRRPLALALIAVASWCLLALAGVLLVGAWRTELQAALTASSGRFGKPPKHAQRRPLIAPAIQVASVSAKRRNVAPPVVVRRAPPVVVRKAPPRPAPEKPPVQALVPTGSEPAPPLPLELDPG